MLPKIRHKKKEKKNVPNSEALASSLRSPTYNVLGLIIEGKVLQMDDLNLRMLLKRRSATD